MSAAGLKREKSLKGALLQLHISEIIIGEIAADTSSLLFKTHTVPLIDSKRLAFEDNERLQNQVKGQTNNCVKCNADIDGFPGV